MSRRRTSWPCSRSCRRTGARRPGGTPSAGRRTLCHADAASWPCSWRWGCSCPRAPAPAEVPPPTEVAAAEGVHTSHRLIVELSTPPPTRWLGQAAGGPAGAAGCAPRPPRPTWRRWPPSRTPCQRPPRGAAGRGGVHLPERAGPGGRRALSPGAERPGHRPRHRRPRGGPPRPGGDARRGAGVPRLCLLSHALRVDGPDRRAGSLGGGRRPRPRRGGVRVASMDGGLHKDAPMFSGEGYAYPPGYPRGLAANTNGKIIASRVYFAPGTPRWRRTPTPGPAPAPPRTACTRPPSPRAAW